MKNINYLFIILAFTVMMAVSLSCVPVNNASETVAPTVSEVIKSASTLFGKSGHYPKIASWLAKKDEVIAGKKPYDLVMSGWFTPEEAAKIKAQNPEVVLLAGLSLNWVWDNQDWTTFLTTVAGYGRNKPFNIVENMYLHNPNGTRCAFGWASEQWGHEEIYAMDPRNPGWAELISAFYKNVLDQPQHDGIIIDMVTEKSWCPGTMFDQEWVAGTILLFQRIKEINVKNKPVIINAGRDITEVDAYSRYFDGYLMENFMGEQTKSTFDDGLKAGENGFKIILAVDTDDTGKVDMNKMRLGLTLSLLNDNMYFTYDFGPRDHGQSWWYKEYDIALGNPLGGYYKKGDAYYREFEKGVVVASPYAATTVNFGKVFIDVTTNSKSVAFNVEKGDGRIYLRTD
jgi:hypothetical protein